MPTARTAGVSPALDPIGGAESTMSEGRYVTAGCGAPTNDALTTENTENRGAGLLVAAKP